MNTYISKQTYNISFILQKFLYAKFYKSFWFIKGGFSYYSSFAGAKNTDLEVFTDFLKTTRELHMQQSCASKSFFLPLYPTKLLQTFSEKSKKYLLNLFYFNPLNIDNAYKVTLSIKIFYYPCYEIIVSHE